MIGKVKVRDVESQVIQATREILDQFSRTELRAYANSIGVNIGRTKPDIIENLLDSGKATICATLGN